MQKEFRFQIISEGLQNGISATCRKYEISRTLYYRWLKRYKTNGMDGLEDVDRNFVPVNKTSSEIEAQILNLIKKYPRYGPQAIKYLLDELEYNISESAVYNVMKRRHLTNMKERMLYAKKINDKLIHAIPPIAELKSGECWLFWITDYGHFETTGRLYEYTLFDLKSRIACTRLYNQLSLRHFEDILTAVAMPVATTLNFNPQYLCFYKDVKILKQSQRSFLSKINSITQANGLDVKHHMLDEHDELEKINQLKNAYSEGCMTFIMEVMHQEMSFRELKIQFQEYVRHYNLSDKLTFDDKRYSPIEYHNKLTNTKPILPIFAYIDRNY